MPVDTSLDDGHGWHCDPKGQFSVRSAYKLAVQMQEHEQTRDASGSNCANEDNHMFAWDKLVADKGPKQAEDVSLAVCT